VHVPVCLCAVSSCQCMKLQETKSTDTKTTLLDYVVEHCLRKSPEILEFPSDMSHVENAIRGMLSASFAL
jgi:hypothetical protein